VTQTRADLGMRITRYKNSKRPEASTAYQPENILRTLLEVIGVTNRDMFVGQTSKIMP
jgi:hypothetical protein